jgi:hypothetical protein
MLGWTVIGIRWEATIGGTTDTGLVRRMPVRIGSSPVTMGTVFLKAIGTVIEGGASTITAGIAIMTAMGIGTGITTATVTSFDALTA